MQTAPLRISIHLLPDFGWTVNGNPVYGPGSALQGFVRVEHAMNDSTDLHEVDQLRILFYASEALAGSKSNTHTLACFREQFFGSQHILWRRKENSEHVMGIFQHHIQDFYFTIEMPMVQYPPSMVYPGLYMTKFRLVASLERKDHSPIITSEELPLQYMPLVESRTTKDEKPVSGLEREQQQGFTLGRSIRHNNATTVITARLDSLNYVTGDQIQINLLDESNNTLDAAYRLTLSQVMNTHDGRHKSTVIAESQSCPLQLPHDMLPTVSYSKFMSIRYKLRVIVSPPLRPSSDSSSSMLRLSRALRPRSLVTFDDIPIHIGTLGYGLRMPADLKPYSMFKNLFAEESSGSVLPPIPVPRFILTDQAKDVLPVYEAYQLPTYEQECGSPF